MGSLRSLGISKPAGLAHLISEGILPSNASDYTWTCDSKSGDELLVVGSRVVWTRLGVVHQIYNLDSENEQAIQALFATFPVGSNTSTTTNAESRSGHGASGKDSSQVSNRAVVVLAKTQAHIYFIGGSTHTINLPFEVQKAFPTTYGLIMQRAAPIKPITISYKATKTPANSFAVARLESQASPESWKRQKLVQEPDPSYEKMWKSYAPPSTQPPQNDLPHHLYLRDPLIEAGIVGEVIEKKTASGRPRVFSDFSLLSQDEDVLYISSRSEVRDRNVLIAATRNPSTAFFTIWEVVETPKRVSIKQRRRADVYLESRRRSSRGPGTGATTPGIRASINPRESFGGFTEPQNATRSRKHKPEAELAHQLNAALEGHTAPTQTSRRISSLMARSELAMGTDAAALTDPVPLASKRGASFGGAGIRASLGGPGTNFGIRSSRMSQFGLEMQEPQLGNLSDDSMDTDSDDHGPTPPRNLSRSLQHDVAFVKLHTFSMPQGANAIDQHFNSSRFEIVVLQSPSASNDSINIFAIYLYDQSSQQAVFINFGIPKTAGLPSARHAGSQIRVRNMETLKNISGICKLGVHPFDCCFMLKSSEKGSVSLIKHAPWNSPTCVYLPSTFLRRNPFQIRVANGVETRREGGLKRILSEGVDRLCGIRTASQPYQLEIVDTKGVWHRLDYGIGPKEPFVRKLLEVCHFLVADQTTEQMAIYSLWDDVNSWYASTVANADNIEWQSFVILLFSLFALHLPHASRGGPVRSKRKTGLLRSSSGAQIDTEDFDAMVLMEDNFGMSHPLWSYDASWYWTAELELPGLLPQDKAPPMHKKRNIILEALQHARNFIKTPVGIAKLGVQGTFPVNSSVKDNHDILTWLLAALHFIREEEKLNVLNAANVQALTPILAQLGGWLKCSEWSWRASEYYSTDSIEMDLWNFDESAIEPLYAVRPQISPPSIFAHVEEVLSGNTNKRFPSLADLPVFNDGYAERDTIRALTPRTLMVLKILDMHLLNANETLSELTRSGWDRDILETLPEGIVASLRSVLTNCQAKPPSNLSGLMMNMIDREDLATLEDHDGLGKPQARTEDFTKHEASRDYHSITNGTLSQAEDVGAYDEAAEMDRRAITRLIFSSDQRFSEAIRMVHPLKPSVARCAPEPDWTDQDLLEAQQELAKVIAFRTLSVSPGRAMLFYNARHPLLTEKFPIHGFSLSTIMKPSNITVLADRTAYTEEKVSWAFFHAGVEAGLTISKDAKGIDTSWILFNKPKELADRHAGFLLALGLNGHLKDIAKWVSFKYLTHKHTMTSIGFLLGLAASHIGSMDVPVARLLSVHATRMLPSGSANLNLSPLIQTTGIMALGLLYYDTQHRRMTEVMLSELESVEQEEGVNPIEDLRDEGYRLAAGFALGYINLGKGRQTKGLNDMKIVERLLALVVAARKVSLVHILDKVTAGATIAIALMFLKTGDQALANKIDIPDTTLQFEYVRPDIFLLRTVARHLIMWDNIEATSGWIKRSLPSTLRKHVHLQQIRSLHTEDLPLYNILAGLCLVIGLRFAGSARSEVRDLLIVYLDQLIRINKLPAMHYDGKLTRITTRNCQDVVALAAAAVMAGTGDLYLIRRYRSLHGRANPDTPYGSHLAAHQAIGLLFLGGGTHTLGTSNLAVASLLCSFYPLFPSSVQDNKAHLQAFRHFWVLAAESRCLIVRNAETLKPMSMKVIVRLRTGRKIEAEAPCLLPELDSISKIISNDRQYWEVVLDLDGNSNHRTAFQKHQSIFVRRRGPYDTHKSTFSATMQTLNDRQAYQQVHRQVFEWVFDLAAFQFLGQAERALVIPPGSTYPSSAVGRLTIVDDRLALEKECLMSTRTERLWSIRVLFAWAESMMRKEDDLAWLGRDIVESLKAKVALTWKD
ncbi:MAG: hypothetical protein GOMPHAMPRED_007409 [Gomphillus americanus]|uniref:Anaphase-promoting complex subunit 1 n=1 Tax=Gomphillus americanus TaxID=1940652 RepID=A0A8H3ERN2_9LECA|nr:MAG: hypothetical protein GOMPHAMPRED_007409 [Gomphillus americanus]